MAANKVWKELRGTLQSIFKVGDHRLRSDLDEFVIEDRFGNKSYLSLTDTKLTFGSKNFYIATEVPTEGIYKEGDIIWNSAPSSNAIVGWYCFSAGTPGTWIPLNASGQLTVSTYADLGDLNVSLLGEGYIAYVSDEELRYEYYQGNWRILNMGGNLIEYHTLEQDLTLGAASSYINHIDPNGAARNISLDTSSEREFKILNVNPEFPLYLKDGSTTVFELSYLNDAIEATFSYSNGIIRVSVLSGSYIVSG